MVNGQVILDDLTDEELIVLYHQNEIRAIEVIIQRYKQFVRQKIRSSFFVGADKEDLIQEGMIGLFKAISDYNPNKDASFRSFATLCVTRQISTAFKTATRQKHLPLNTSISLNLPVGMEEEEGITLMDTLKASENANPEKMMIDQEDVERLQKHMKQSLSKLEWQVLTLHTEGKNYHEIAAEMNKPVKSIDNAIQRIKRKLSERL